VFVLSGRLPVLGTYATPRKSVFFVCPSTLVAVFF
jgi:hypothetical protein